MKISLDKHTTVKGEPINGYRILVGESWSLGRWLMRSVNIIKVDFRKVDFEDGREQNWLRIMSRGSQ